MLENLLRMTLKHFRRTLTSLLTWTDLVMMDSLLGGFSETKKATEEIQKICDQVKHQVERHTNKTYKVFTAVEYREQIVAGRIFLIKVHAGEQNYIFLNVFRKLQCDGGGLELLGVQENHHKPDPLVPF
uniref:cystatin-B-like n=1 Tax=Scatophagus argus TaxID=75038 RepID=UPI001ED815BD|nr:cystatin-B-like [Scatophagus argus]